MALEAGGKALVPLRMYFVVALVKIEVALCIGKQLYDKREDLKRRAELMEARKALKFRLR
jgi:SsrA-binding protein